MSAVSVFPFVTCSQTHVGCIWFVIVTSLIGWLRNLTFDCIADTLSVHSGKHSDFKLYFYPWFSSSAPPDTHTYSLSNAHTRTYTLCRDLISRQARKRHCVSLLCVSDGPTAAREANDWHYCWICHVREQHFLSHLFASSLYISYCFFYHQLSLSLSLCIPHHARLHLLPC